MKWFSGKGRAAQRQGELNGQIVEIDTASGPVPVELRTHVRARRYSLRQSASSRTICLTIPKGGTVDAGIAFARSQGAWLSRHHKALAPATPFADGAVIPYRGEAHLLRWRAGFRGQPKIVDEAGAPHPIIEVTSPPEHFARRLTDWLKAEARRELGARVQQYADELGVKPGRISVRDQSSRWGSCSSGGNLSFSWRLVLAPPGILDYVAAHEVAHLIEMNHSARFWNIVESLQPDMKARRKWLRQNSAMLHAVGRA